MEIKFYGAFVLNRRVTISTGVLRRLGLVLLLFLLLLFYHRSLLILISERRLRVQPVWKSKFYGAFTPSTRRRLDGVAMPACQSGRVIAEK